MSDLVTSDVQLRQAVDHLNETVDEHRIVVLRGFNDVMEALGLIAASIDRLAALKGSEPLDAEA
jgi:hypothetical protein